MTEDFILSLQMDDKDNPICDDLLAYYERNDEYKHRGLSNGGNKLSTDVSVYPNSIDPAVVRYLEFLRFALKKYREKYEMFSFLLRFGEAFNIQHYKPGEGYFNWHCERGMHQTNQRALVFMTYLNDVDDGGQTQFLYQKREVQPKKGLTLLWPTDFTHTHRGVVSPTQPKTIATGWYNYLDVVAQATVKVDSIELLQLHKRTG